MYIKNPLAVQMISTQYDSVYLSIYTVHLNTVINVRIAQWVNEKQTIKKTYHSIKLIAFFENQSFSYTNF